MFITVLRFSASCKRPKRSSNFTIESRNIWNLTKRQRLFSAQRPIIHHSTKIQTSSRWKIMQDNDYNYRHDQNVLSSNTLRKEIEDLRFLLNEKNRSNNEYQAEIGAVRD